ncbi:PEP-CTERM sorting domain-containing protein [Massilia sp. IC2-477]|uniref:PEP-CTERM sorting domain-containing protein n=1 Tax=Massilia sp. IC2-477 TaxID=2887198 RepID=UPI001D1014D7|nr:PEP-CTERM sorting domain-containing protein [Massilia sp. IC2-477]MCC2955366.1 PEP-CTERM sorting domain-containing protein [Massilia sp. IC2-477]
MLIRRLVIAALFAGAGAAHADTIPAQSSNAGSGWTAGNGTDVLGSGVMKDNVNLVGGIAHGADSNAAVDALLGKVAGTVTQVDGQTKLYLQSGIEANYVLADSNSILAATIGPGKSVVSTADGKIISDGLTKAPGMSGGGNNTTGSTGGSGSGSSGSGSSGSGSSGSSGGSGSTGSGSQSGGSTGGAQTGESVAPVVSNPGSIGANPQQVSPAATAIPEPSSIALMLVGMVGAGAMTRRRAR